MNNKVVLAVIVIALLGAGVVLAQRNAPATVSPSPTPVVPQASSSPQAEASPLASPLATPDAMTTPAGAVKTFAVSGDNFAFDVKEMKVKKGDTVRITFTNAEGMHDWVIDEFDARTKVLPAGQSETIEFVADEAGTFEYYCSVGQHRQMGMKGSLIVE